MTPDPDRDGDLTGDLAQAWLGDPADAAGAVLDRFFSGPARLRDSLRSPLPLAAFQADAAARILHLLETRGGALLADSVGLGKTHVALAVIERSVSAGTEPVLVVTPAALRRQWVGPLRRLARQAHGQLGLPGTVQPGRTGPTLEWASHARLARGHLARCLPRLIVVDEAHGFRNPRTRRYRELARLCVGARVLLLTATPINNSLSDLYFQLRLFLGDGDLADLGIADLRACLRPGPGETRPGIGALRTAIAALTVRRTRRVLESAAVGAGLRFPHRDPPVAVRYDLESAYGANGLEAVLSEIENLRLEVHGRGSSEPGRRVATQLLRISLLKRLESSSAALTASLHRLAAFLRECERAIPAGRLPVPCRSSFTDPDQLVLGPIVHRDLPRGLDLDQLTESVAADLERVLRIRTLLGAAGPVDPKVTALVRLLRGPLSGRSALIFTEFRDTAVHLYRALLPHHRTGMVTGREAMLGAGLAPRRRVIDAFAPVSNGVDVPPESRLDVLIATDVLAEGLNLQDCADVVSFDLPWNPVRLVQRIGRIDRLGSIHDRIRIYNFIPDHGLENVLGLMARIRSKLDTVRAAGGFDIPEIDGPGAGVAGLRTVFRRLHASDPALLSDLEAGADQGFELEEHVHAIARRRQVGRPAPDGPLPPSPSTKRPAPRPTEGPVVATLTRPVGEVGGWLVVASHRGNPRFLFVKQDQVREDRSAALGLLAEAVSGADPDRQAMSATERRAVHGCSGGEARGPEAEAVAAAARFLQRGRVAPVHRPDPAGRVAGMLLRRLGQIPGGAGPAECRRADAILERLRRGVGWGAAVALERALDEERNQSSGPGTCAAFMDRLESMLSRRDAAVPRPASAERPRLVAVFRLVPSADLVLEPERG